MRPKVQERRFSIADGMILIAATAGGMSWSSVAWRTSAGSLATRFGGLPFSEKVLVIAALAIPFLLSWTGAIVLLRLRKPRRRWRVVTSEAGATAGVAVLIGLLLLTPMIVSLCIRYRTRWEGQVAEMALEYVAMIAPALGFSVLVSWLVQVVQRRWRPAKSWIDRGGRALAAAWIVEGIYFAYFLMDQFF